MPDTDNEPKTGAAGGNPDGTSRRHFIRNLGLAGVLGGGAVAVGAGFGGGFATAKAVSGTSDAPDASGLVEFYGKHQAGIATPAQDRLAFAAFDVTSTDVSALQGLLAQWAAVASLLTQGKQAGPVDTAPQAPPFDTGEAVGLPPSQLTITVGFGPTLFDDRFGLAKFKPAALADIPALPRDALDPAISNGDLCVQACANDPTVAFHAIRNFARLARGTAVMRWSQLGFGRTSSTSKTQETQRNLMGFKDGTNNIKADESGSGADQMDSYVWVGDETDQDWMKGGSYLVSRRIRMLIESWDTDYLADQEQVFGRFKTSGAPLTGKTEFDVVDLDAKDGHGNPVIDLNAHIRLASPKTNGGQMILRRGYSYTDGIDPVTGYLDAGLFFIAFQKDPRKQFVPLQTKLGQHDNLNEYIRHTSSGLYAVPAGLSGPGDYYGKSFFA